MSNENTPKVAVKTPEKEPLTLSAFDHKLIDRDIKYRGPLSYRYLRLIGWMAMAMTLIAMVMNAAVGMQAIFPEQAEKFAKLATASGILSMFSSLPLPLFLIANFTVILQSKNNYKKLLLTYLKIILIIYVGFIVVYYHYIVVVLMRVGGMSFLEARETSIAIFTILGKQSGLVVNVFIDLFSCCLILFFIDYKPKKHFQGKKIALFRLMVLLPILYEIASAILMGLLSLNAVSYDFMFYLPPEILPLLGKKPIGMIAGFVIICIYIRMREKIYLKRGGTEEGYALYVETRRNSFRFSLMMSTTFFVIAIIDFFVVLIPISAMLPPDLSEGDQIQFVAAWISVLEGFTLGKSVCLLLVIPFVMLFSYTKRHANPKLDKLIPLIGVGLVIFATIETLFFVLLF